MKPARYGEDSSHRTGRSGAAHRAMIRSSSPGNNHLIRSSLGDSHIRKYSLPENAESVTLIRVVCMCSCVHVCYVDLIDMLSAVSNVPSAGACKTPFDLVISSWNLLMEPDILVQPCRGDIAVDSRKTQGKAIADFRVESTSGSEAVLASAENSKASSNVGGQSALTATCSSDRLDTEQGKYDTGDKISRQTRLSKSKKPKAINSVAPPREDQICNTDLKMKDDLARHTKIHNIKRFFQCEACGREFRRLDNLKRHTKIHIGEHPFQCDVCEKTLTQKHHLIAHKRIHTGEHPFPCDVCEKTFTQKHHLEEHKRIHTGEHPFPCDVCGKAFIQKHHLTRHKRIHTGEHPFPCDVCEKTFTQDHHLIAHKRIHTGEHPFPCDECEKAFIQKNNLIKHKRVHTGERSFPCDVCEKTFTQKHHLIKHTRIHTGERPFPCDVCKREFISADDLERHKRIHIDKRPFPCDVCEKTFTQKHHLTKHKRIHTGERPFPCDVCEKTFTQKHHLKEHTRIHTGERPFPCDECGKAFTQKQNLIGHKRTHTGEHPFQCNACGKAFTQQQSLTVHKRTHTGERPFQCSVCMKNFGRADVLRNHMKTHGDERPFKCTECGKGFLRKSHLNDHTFSHSSTPLFKCEVCDNSFYQKSSFKRHVCTNSEKHPHKANKKSSKISRKRFTNDRNPGQPEPDHNNEKSFKSSHRNASFTSTATSNQHIKPKNHTTNSETGLTNPGNFSTITQLPSASNQSSTSDIHVNKSQNQEKYGEYSEYAETVALLNELADTYPITLEPGSFEHHDDLFLDQEMPEATFPDRQNANADCLITQLHPVVDWPSTSGIHVDKSQDQEKYEEIATVLAHNYLQPSPPQTIPGLRLSSW